MKRIIVLNPKGGSGKTTIATNLAANFAVAGHHAALMDLDPQGSSMRWLKNRARDRAAVHGIAGFEHSTTVTRSWQLRVPSDCSPLIIDTSAAIDSQTLPEMTRGADAILVPVMPSDIDIHAAARCIADLLLVAKIKRSDERIGIVANRVRSNTLVSQSLMRFLRSLDIPLVATLRDTQNYVRCAESGVGIHELPRWQVRQDLDAWDGLMRWLDRRQAPSRSESANLATHSAV
ncbi:MAG: AAA family ATPase [Gammaproteobacteria bacterium]|nr:AAA family ATPase [Gammaproteobacteria bacterium]